MSAAATTARPSAAHCRRHGGSATQCGGHPDDKIGFAVGAGIKINFPMIGPGDYFQAQVNYTQGAVRYAAHPGWCGSSRYLRRRPSDQPRRRLVPGRRVLRHQLPAAAASRLARMPAVSSVELTTAWSVQAAYEHFWTPSLRTSLVGATPTSATTARRSCMMCDASNAHAGGQHASPSSPTANCGAGSFDWSYWSISSRTQWNITKDFYVGLEGYYGHLNTMSKGRP